MTDRIDDGGPAFACIATSAQGDLYHQLGMDLRDYFAGQALLLIGLWMEPDHSTGTPFDGAAQAAYALADAMIAARKGAS